MDHEQFLNQVVERGRFDTTEQAATATAATLSALGARISAGAASRLASALPAEVGQNVVSGAAQADATAAGAAVTADDDAPAFDAEQLCARVADQAGADPAVAHAQTGAVIATVRDAVPAEEWTSVTGQLPAGFVDALLGR